MIAASGENGSAASCQNRAPQRAVPGGGQKAFTDIATARVIDGIVTLEDIDLAPMLRFQSAPALCIRDACGALGPCVDDPEHAHTPAVSTRAGKKETVAGMEQPFRHAAHRNAAIADDHKPQPVIGLDQQHPTNTPRLRSVRPSGPS
jgi:hypothetical protein